MWENKQLLKTGTACCTYSGQTIEVRLHYRLQAGTAAGALFRRGMIGMAAVSAWNRRMSFRHFHQPRRSLLRDSCRTGQNKSVSQNTQAESEKEIRHGRQTLAQRAIAAQTAEEQAAQHIQSRNQPAPTHAARPQIVHGSLALMKQRRTRPARIILLGSGVAGGILGNCLWRLMQWQWQAVIVGDAGTDHEACGEGNKEKSCRFAHSYSREEA